jgi:hypothetical protein
MSTSAWYYRFAPKGPRRGTAVVTLSRAAACGGGPPSRMTIRLTRIRLNASRQPLDGPPLAVRRVVLHSTPCQTLSVRLPVREPFRIDVTADRTFQPSPSDQRQLSAQIGFAFKPDKR